MAKSKRRIPKRPPSNVQIEVENGVQYALDGDYLWTLHTTQGWKRTRVIKPEVMLKDVNPLALLMIKIAHKKGIGR